MPASVYSVEISRGTFTDGRARLRVMFSNTQGGTPQYEWTPRWLEPRRGVADLLREAVRVERDNRPGSQWLKEFAALARDIVIEHAPPVEVRRQHGRFFGYSASSGKSAPEVTVVVGDLLGSGKFWTDDLKETWVVTTPLTTEALRELQQGGIHTWLLWDNGVIDVLRRDGTSLIT